MFRAPDMTRHQQNRVQRMADERVRHHPALAATGFLSRLPVGIAIVTLLAVGADRDYPTSWTGALATAYTVGVGVSAPSWGKVNDRRGPMPVLAACALLFLTGALLLIVGPLAPECAATAAGLMGLGTVPVSALMRVTWARVLTTDAARREAVHLESLFAEGVHIAGRILVSVLLAASTALTTATIAVFGFLGPLALMANRHIRYRPPPTVGSNEVHGRWSVSAVSILACATAMSTAHGAFATALMQASSAGPAQGALLMGLWGIGSLLGGLRYLRGVTPSAVTGLLAFGVLSTLTIAIALPLSPVIAMIAVVVAGTPITPTFTGIYQTAETCCHPARKTQFFGMISSAVLIGFGVGTTFSGVLATRGNLPAACLLVISGCTPLAAAAAQTARTSARSGSRLNQP